MEWIEKVKKFLDTIKQDRTTLRLMREDCNDNTANCSKLLYRLEEAELQIKNNQARYEELEARKQDKTYPSRY